MKIMYKGVSMELVRYGPINKSIGFLFQNKGVIYSLFKRYDGCWYFGLNGSVTDEDKKTNELYLWAKKIEDKFQEGRELYKFLFKESPLRVKLLLELGPDAYEKYK